MEKRYVYKVYDSTGATFIGLWAEVISDYEPVEQINTAGCEVTVQLARPADNFSEGTDVDFNLRVEIYCFDTEQPNGLKVFSGYIANYTPVEGADEYIEVQLLSYGSRADLAILKNLSATTPFYNSYSEAGGVPTDSGYPFGGATWSSTPFYAEGDNLTQVVASLHWDNVANPAPPATTGTMQAALYSASGTLPGSILSSWVNSSSVFTSLTQTFDFSNVSAPISPGLKYFMVFRATGASVAGWYPKNPFLFGTAFGRRGSTDSGATWFNLYPLEQESPMIVQLYNDAVDTSVSYASVDPGAMFRDIMDRWIATGGPLSYTTATIELTGTTVSYDFIGNTVWEGWKKSLETAPAGWHLYVDMATNLVHFHPKATTPEHRFIIGKDIFDLKPEKRSEDIANQIYFIGGGDPQLFKLYKNQSSIDKFDPRAKRYIDQRVTLAATAETIAQALLDQLGSPELRLNFELVDSNFAADGNGYDTESITVGDMMGLRNIVGASGPTLWDVSKWDIDRWDYNIRDLTSPLLQIVRIERIKTGARIFCSTVPPDVSKRIQDINRNLEASQTVNIPSAPS